MCVLSRMACGLAQEPGTPSSMPGPPGQKDEMLRPERTMTINTGLRPAGRVPHLQLLPPSTYPTDRPRPWASHCPQAERRLMSMDRQK